MHQAVIVEVGSRLTQPYRRRFLLHQTVSCQTVHVEILRIPGSMLLQTAKFLGFHVTVLRQAERTAAGL